MPSKETKILLANLRLFVWRGETKLAGGLARRLAVNRCARKGDVTVEMYLSFIGRILLEDKYPEGAKYFRSLQHTLTSKIKDAKANVFVQYAVAASRLKSSQMAFQYAFVAMRKNSCGQPNIDEAVERAILYKSKKDKVEIADKCDINNFPLSHFTFSNDWVLKMAWSVMTDSLKTPATPVPTVRVGVYKPVANDALPIPFNQKRKRASTLYQNEVAGFMEQMELYIHDYGDSGYGDPVPLLATMRTEERLQRSLPVAHGGVPVTLVKKRRGGWEVEMDGKMWFMSHPKMQTDRSLEKIKTFYHGKTGHEAFDVRRAGMEAIKYRKQVYFMQEIVKGSCLTGFRVRESPYVALPVLKVLVYRHSRRLCTCCKDILLTADGAISVNETRLKHLLKHPNVWRKLFESPARATGVIEALRPAVLSQAFKDFMTEVGMTELHGRLVESINNAQAL